MNDNSGSTTIKRVVHVIKILKGHSINDLSNKELATASGESPANITRTLNTLVSEGMVQHPGSGRYALGMQLLYIAQAFSNKMASG